MTISSTANRATFSGSGTTGPFPFPYPLITKADLVVISVNDTTAVETTLVLDTDYTLSGTPDSVGRYNAGVDITTASAVASGYTLVTFSDPALTQAIDFVENDPDPVEQTELGLDKLTLIARRLDDRIERSLRISDGTTGINTELPTPVGNSAIGWNATATELVNITMETGTSLADLGAASGAALIGYTAEGLETVTHTVADALDNRVCIFNYMTDAQIADVQAGTLALDLSNVWDTVAVRCRGKTLSLPKGKYLYDTDNGPTTLEEINIVGEGVLDGATATLDQGSVICITGTTNSPFKIRRGVSFDGVAFYYPNQTDSATPTAYPPMLDFDFTDGAVQFVNFKNNVVYNAYRVIRIDDATGNVGHVWIDDNVIYGISTCIEMTHNLEVIKIRGNNFTFGHWLAATEAGCRGYTRANGKVFVMPKTDGYVFTDNMMYGYKEGVSLETTGTCQLINIADNLFDQVRYPIKGSGTGNVTGLQVTGNSFLAFNSQATSAAGNSISISTSGNAVTEILTIVGNTFNTCTEDAILVSGNTPTRSINITGNTFNGWAGYKAAGDYGAIKISGNNTSYTATGNEISASSAYASGILGSCSAATIVGNKFIGCIAVINASYNAGACAGNSSFSTSGTFSDLTSGLTQSGNVWDKPQSWIDTATAATYTLGTNVKTVICNRAGTITVTLPTAVANAGRRVKFRTITANTVVSASSNVVPIAGGAAGTAILAASSGAWCELECDGTSWQIIAS